MHLSNRIIHVRSQFLLILLIVKFKWDGGGKEVYISGTFSDWKTLPMVKSHGDFVTIIDLPEGDHQYKFCVDGEWRHDPKLVSVLTKFRCCSSNEQHSCFIFEFLIGRKTSKTKLDPKIIWCRFGNLISKFFKRWPKTVKML